jgi:WD40 repeat protein
MQRISKKRAQGMRGAVVLQSDGPNIIDIVDLAAGEVLHKIRFPYGWIVINAIASPFKTKLYVTSVSSASLHVKEYSVWDIGTAARLECPPELTFESIEMSNIGFAMVTNNFDVCDVESCTVICSCWQEEVMPRDYFGNRVGVCKFSGDDSKIIALVAKRIFVCETLSGALCYEFLGHEGVPVTAVASKNDVCVSADCVKGGTQAKYIIWDYSTGSPRHEFTSHRARRLLFGADEETLFAEDGQKVFGLRGSSGTQFFSRRYSAGILSLVYSPVANSLVVMVPSMIVIHDGGTGNVISNFSRTVVNVSVCVGEQVVLM